MTIKKLPTDLVKFFAYFIVKQKWSFVILMITMSCWAIQESVYPYFIKLIIDKIVTTNLKDKQLIDYLKPTLLIASLLVVIIEINYRIFDFLSARVYPRFMAQIRSELYNYVLEHSHNYFINNLTGTIASKISRMPEATQRIIDLFLTVFFPIILTFIISCTILAFTNPIFAIIVLIWLSIHLGITLFFSKNSSKLALIHSHQLTKLNGKIVDVITNITSVRLFSHQLYERNYLAKFQEQEITDYSRQLKFTAKVKFILGLVSICFLFGMIGISIYFYSKNLITLGDLGLILSYYSLVGLVWSMGMEIIAFYELIGNAKEALELVNQNYEIQNQSPLTKLIIKEGKIEFRNVTFTYSKNNNVFNNKSIIINAKENIGLVGFSGSGKTTFINLMLRYFDVKSGQILIDNQDISQLSQSSLREAITLIPQDAILFHRTIKENIHYGNLEASDDQIIHASKQAYAHEFISKLPQQYETIVGDKGSKLSGGQRQRIIIARAILKNSNILILDEATSSLDSITEQQIQASIEQLKQNKTVIIIAHRLSTLLSMDRILVFDQGTIIEDGTHEDLLIKQGHYAKLWSMQIGGFLNDNKDI